MCFSLGWVEQLLVYLVIVCAVIAILKLFVPWIVAQLGYPIIGQILNIVLWAFITILIIYLVFGLLSCLLGGGGIMHFPGR
jgi:hypothetical protein